MSSKVTTLPTSRPAPRAAEAPPLSLDEIRAPVRTDLAAVDTMIRARLKSTVPLVDGASVELVADPSVLPSSSSARRATTAPMTSPTATTAAPTRRTTMLLMPTPRRRPSGW